jgi:3-oxoacyl-[acyl-carrier-protein] synthase II
MADEIAAIRAPEPNLGPGDHHHLRRTDRAARLGLGAALQALVQADLDARIDPTRVGVMMGTGRGPLGRTVETVDELAAGAMGPSGSADTTPGGMSGVVAQQCGFGGPSATVIATCASGAAAIIAGALHLLAGEADAMLVGGAEAPLIPLMVAQLRAAGVSGWHDDAELTCRPFDATRNGMVLGEGAAMLVLEREPDALRRGARPLARLSGWGLGVDAGGRTGVTADGAGLVRVARRALERARLEPEQIDYINAHGTGTRLNDAVEARALNSIFGRDRLTPVSSTKPITGHCLGATAALEAVIAIEVIRGGCLPPTANYRSPDPEIEIELVAGEARPARVRAVMSTSLGFWGAQAALVFEAV